MHPLSTTKIPGHHIAKNMRLGRKQKQTPEGGLGTEEEHPGEFPEFSFCLTDLPDKELKRQQPRKGTEYRQEPRGPALSLSPNDQERGGQPDTTLGSRNFFPPAKCQKWPVGSPAFCPHQAVMRHHKEPPGWHQRRPSREPEFHPYAAGMKKPSGKRGP